MLISTGGKKRCCILRDWDRTLRTVMKRAWSMEQRPQPSVPVEFGGGGRGTHGVWFLALQQVLRRMCAYSANASRCLCCQTEVSICCLLNRILGSVFNVPLIHLTKIYLVCPSLRWALARSWDGRGAVSP